MNFLKNIGKKAIKLLFSNIPAGKYFGIPVGINGTLVALYLFLLIFNLTVELDVSEHSWIEQYFKLSLLQFGILSSLYLVVLLHEFGHALTARYFGYKCHWINLNLAGGLANLEMPENKAKEEFWIALNGPLVNLSLAAITLPFAYFTENLFFSWFYFANLCMVIFNIFPIYPMDGGRLLRAMLASLIGDWQKAAEIIFKLSFVLGPVLGLLSIINGFYMAGFIFISLPGLAYFEYKKLQTKQIIETLSKESKGIWNESPKNIAKKLKEMNPAISPIMGGSIVEAMKLTQEFMKLTLESIDNIVNEKMILSKTSNKENEIKKITNKLLKTLQSNYSYMEIFYGLDTEDRKVFIDKMVRHEISLQD